MTQDVHKMDIVSLKRLVRMCRVYINQLSSCAMMELIYGQCYADTYEHTCKYCLFNVDGNNCVATRIQSAGVE